MYIHAYSFVQINARICVYVFIKCLSISIYPYLAGLGISNWKMSDCVFSNRHIQLINPEIYQGVQAI